MCETIDLNTNLASDETQKSGFWAIGLDKLAENECLRKRHELNEVEEDFHLHLTSPQRSDDMNCSQAQQLIFILFSRVFFFKFALPLP